MLRFIHRVQGRSCWYGGVQASARAKAHKPGEGDGIPVVPNHRSYAVQHKSMTEWTIALAKIRSLESICAPITR
jgi:hypothetical protein